jgi:peptide subunit release factor 1 (eRF1)
MINREIIRELADFQSPQGDAITFYYQPDTPPDKSHRHEVIHIKDLVKEAIHRAERAGKNGSVRGDLQRILETADHLHGNSGKAKAIFACGSQNMWREVDLPARLPKTDLLMNNRFHVSPLTSLHDALERVCITLVDRSKARFFDMQMEKITEQEGFVDELSRRGRSDGFGGFEAGHVERKADNDALNHFKHVADRLLEKYGSGSCERLLIGCRDEAWPSLEKQLHPYVKQRLAARFVIDPALATPDEVRQQAMKLLADYQNRRREMLLRETMDESRANNHGALGLKRVLRSLELGEIQTLLIGDGFTGAGVECTNCGHLDMRMVGSCAVCGQKTREIEDITDALVGRAMRFGIEVIRMPSTPEFQKAGNIGALLRFRAERSVGEKLA